MACILLSDMDRPALTPTTQHNGLLPDPDPEPAPAKQDEGATCLTVHLYNRVKAGGGCGAKGSESTLTFPAGEYVAEDLCISAAKACGESWDHFSCAICPHALFNTVRVDAATTCLPSLRNKHGMTQILLHCLQKVWPHDVVSKSPCLDFLRRAELFCGTPNWRPTSCDQSFTP